MLDWLASKIGVLIAIGVLTTFVLGLFAWQHSTIVDREGQMLADNISEMIDSMSGMEAATILNISFGDGSGQLPSTIGGKEYSINITSDRVIIKSEGKLWSSSLVIRVIPHNLTERSFNLTERAELDALAWTGEMESGENIYLERGRIEVSGNVEYMTLVYRR